MDPPVDDSDSDPEKGSRDSEYQEEDDWEDAEDDSENVQIVSLFDQATFRSVNGMLQHCKLEHDFDFIQVVKDLGL